MPHAVFSPGSGTIRKDQLFIFRFLQPLLQYTGLTPFPYFLYTQREDVKYICLALIFHQTPPLAHALFWCHLLRDTEDNNKSSYLLSACCELSIYISDFTFSVINAAKDSIRSIFIDLESKAQKSWESSPRLFGFIFEAFLSLPSVEDSSLPWKIC